MTDFTLHNPHAGEILKHEFIDAIGISQNALANALHVPANRIHHIVNGTRSITADTDLRLCKFFGLSEGYFLRLQSLYEIMKAKKNLKGQIDSIPLYSAYMKTITNKKHRNSGVNAHI